MLSVRRKVTRGSVTGPKDQRAHKVRPCLESLESRVVLYSATGNLWPNPQVITISFMPDGTNVGGTVPSNLSAVFNKQPKLVAANWQSQILRAAQVWAQQTNINFVVVPDSGNPIGSGNFQQGDPSSGDIRIGGYPFGSTTLAWSFQPPPVNNFSMAGDILFNTGMGYSVGTTYDLFTVATHEFGHALGLGHTSTETQVGTQSILQSVMLAGYNAVKSNLITDDIAGIESIYSSGYSRSPDGFDAVNPNGTFATATNLNPMIDPYALTALVTNLDITSTSDIDDYVFSAPASTTGNLTVNVQSSGLSLLAPKVTIYAANQTTVLGTANGLNEYGTTLSVSVTGVSAGQVFYVKVQGADTTAFGTGAYAMTMNFGSNPSPTVPLSGIQIPNGSPISAGGGIAYSTQGHDGEDEHGDGFRATPVQGQPQVSDGFEPGDNAPPAQLARPALLAALGLSVLVPVVALARKGYFRRRRSGRVGNGRDETKA
jgi:hypothetical protein